MGSNGIHSCYLDRCFEPEEVRRMVHSLNNRLRPHRHAFDAIACQGWSGALVAPILALRLNKPLIMVRKEGDNGHSAYAVEGYLKSRSYVIVDDFVSSGSTVKRIIETIKDQQGKLLYNGNLSVQPLATCYGTALYSEGCAAGNASNIYDHSPRVWTLRDEWTREGPVAEEQPVEVQKTTLYLGDILDVSWAGLPLLSIEVVKTAMEAWKESLR